MIISVVIMALLQMHGNTTNLFSHINEKTKVSQYVSLFIANPDYGFEKKSVNLDELVKDFDLDDELRQKLKESKVDIVYQELDSLDLSNPDETDEFQEINQSSSNMILYIGKTVLKTDKASAALLRITASGGK